MLAEFVIGLRSLCKRCANAPPALAFDVAGIVDMLCDSTSPDRVQSTAEFDLRNGGEEGGRR